MEECLIQQSKPPRRKLTRAAAPLQWLLGHPVSSAVLYMLLGGLIVYLLLASSSSQQMPQQTQPQRTVFVPQLANPHSQSTAAATASSNAGQSSDILPTPAESLTPTLCTDSCYKSNDGVCDDGRFLANMTRQLASTVLCDLGTDCSDCGVWKGVQNSSSWTESVGPIEYLRRANLTVLVKRSDMEPHFYFAYTDPAHDIDHSNFFHNLGIVEPVLTHVTYQVLHGPCQKPKSGLMVDVGANFGWYSLLASMLGCRVVAFEPVTTFRAYMEYSIARNKLQDAIQLRPTVAVRYPSAAGDTNYTVIAPQRGVWGTASIDGKNIDRNVDNKGTYFKINVTGETLDQVLQAQQLRHVALLKVDVEGYEASVIAGAGELLHKQLADNVLLEYSPHVLQHHDIKHLDQEPRMLLSVLAAGYTIGHIAKKDFGERIVTSLSEPLEMLPAVTETNLKFDLLDCMQMTEKGMMWLKSPCKEMMSLQLIGDGLPERLHPKSFRSSFEVDTNIWASRDARFIPYLQGPAVGVFPPERKLTQSWFIPEWSDAGMGGRSCRNLQEVAVNEKMTAKGRAAFLVRHRCRCGSEQPCEHEETIADTCAQEGETPFRDDPNFVPDR